MRLLKAMLFAAGFIFMVAIGSLMAPVLVILIFRHPALVGGGLILVIFLGVVKLIYDEID